MLIFKKKMKGEPEGIKLLGLSVLNFYQECTAVPDRQHGDISFMAKAILTRDLISQVSQRCPKGCPISSEKENGTEKAI